VYGNDDDVGNGNCDVDKGGGMLAVRIMRLNYFRLFLRAVCDGGESPHVTKMKL
jgi:hypothetical protein